MMSRSPTVADRDAIPTRLGSMTSSPLLMTLVHDQLARGGFKTRDNLKLWPCLHPLSIALIRIGIRSRLRRPTMAICRAMMMRVASSHEGPLCDSRAILLLERRRLLKEHNVSRLVDSDALWEHVSPAHQTRERIVRWLCGFLHRRVGENCGAGGPRVLGAFLCLPLERFSGEIIVKGLGS